MSWEEVSRGLLLVCATAGCLVGIGLVALLQWRLRWPGGGPAAEGRDLHPYEIAALRNGPAKPVNIALARLVREGLLAFDARNWTLAPCGELPATAHPLERAIFAAVVADPETSGFDAALIALLRAGALTASGRRLRTGGRRPDGDGSLEQAVYDAVAVHPGDDLDDLRAAVVAHLPVLSGVGWIEPPGRYIEEVRDAAAGEAAALRKSLVGRGLVMPELRADQVRMTPAYCVMAGVLLFAFASSAFDSSAIDKGTQDTMICYFAPWIVGTWLLLALPANRTRRGDRFLARLKRTNAALKRQWKTSEELTLSQGLFGLDVLAGTDLARLHSSPSDLSRLWRWLRGR